MNAPVSINDLSHEDICAWLERALQGQESLPKLTPDESPHIGILRLEKTLKPATRDSLRDGGLQLVRRFCAEGRGETMYVEELLALTASFKNPEAVAMLVELALQFPQLPHVSDEIRLAVLAVLVDTPPPQSPDFWNNILQQNSAKYAGLALSGVLATNPEQAIRMLPVMPDIKRLGQAAALKLDLAWDDLPPKKRFQFVQDVQAIVSKCGSAFAAPLREWVDSKKPARTAINSSLSQALSDFLGPASSARVLSSKLAANEELALAA